MFNSTPFCPAPSSGPLLNSKGELVGLNTAIFTPTGSSVGVGFAIPVDTVRRIVPQLIQFGRVVRPRRGSPTTCSDSGPILLRFCLDLCLDSA